MLPFGQEAQTQVAQLIDQGNHHSGNEQHLEAIRCFSQALDFFPNALEKCQETLWLFTAIGDSLFQIGRYEEATNALSNAVRCGGLGNPFIHLRLGQSHYEIGSPNKAADELTRAYMAEGEEIFQDEPAKYFEFLKTKIKVPV